MPRNRSSWCDVESRNFAAYLCDHRRRIERRLYTELEKAREEWRAAQNAYRRAAGSSSPGTPDVEAAAALEQAANARAVARKNFQLALERFNSFVLRRERPAMPAPDN